jgi:hypothetical protein
MVTRVGITIRASQVVRPPGRHFSVPDSTTWILRRTSSMARWAMTALLLRRV